MNWTEVLAQLAEYENQPVLMAPRSKPLHGVDKQKPVGKYPTDGQPRTARARAHATGRVEASTLVLAVQRVLHELDASSNTAAWGSYPTGAGSSLRIIAVESGALHDGKIPEGFATASPVLVLAENQSTAPALPIRQRTRKDELLGRR